MTQAENKISLPRRGLLLGGAIMAVGAAAPKAAFAFADPVNLSVVDRETGQTLPLWRRNGRAFVAGDPGARYALRMTNRTGARVLAVLSIDGVNILTGETAAYDQRGYVFGPHETYDVTGWRKSDNEVADFTFTPLSLSYAARTGRPGDVGVIGMAVFDEKIRPPSPAISASDDVLGPRPSVRQRFADAPPIDAPAPVERAASPPPPAMPSSQSPSSSGLQDRARGWSSQASVSERLGTGHGPRELSEMTTVAFERATRRPQSVSEIEYDTFEHLIARGVISPKAAPRLAPRPFPMTPDPSGYVPDPPGS